ncbi:MAG: dihydrolipoyl dehydrogenase [Spirochaetales bacterium]|nr:dihydrolipoyl dehydrogenase [Leptospiraceae bacterium]MCP5480679.1 dihydrolipoyl dehydrogenase [Spirochaetales bacterium]MCP5484031.1 dihydrolipoyl dehydrogenase [Spirochaetales bacterium]
MSEFDLVIIGGGPGGYVCGIRAAQLGLKTAIIEKRPTMGGTCVNVGCIPSKALLDSSHKYHDAQHGLQDHGIDVGKVKLDLKKLMSRKVNVVKELTDGLDFLMKKNKITVLRGHGRFVGKDSNGIDLEVEGEKKEKVRAKNVVIATGSAIIELPNMKPDGKHIITSDEAIALDQVPDHLIIIGAGVIGLELGSVWHRLGARVTIVELLPGILMSMDRQMREQAQRILTKQGLEFLFEHKVTEAKVKGKEVVVTLEGKDQKKSELKGDRLLVAVGRRPYTDDLGLDKVGVKLNQRGRVEVDPHSLATGVPGIYAIGDVIEGAMLAHRAEDEGVMVAENLAGKKGHVNYEAVPWIVYTWPEIAWVGRGEEALKEAGIEYRTGKYMFKPNGRAKAMNEPDGQVKFIADKRTDKILGVFIVGPNASELIAEAVIAVEFGGSAEDIARSFHAHPTLAEVMREAAMDVDKRALHG